MKRKSRQTSEKVPAKAAVPSASKALTSARYLVMGNRLSALSREVARGFSRGLHVRLIEHSVTIGEYSFLRALWLQDGITQRELAECVGLMESTTSIAIKSLAKLGFVEGRKKPNNSKQIHVFLTADGEALEQKLKPISVEIHSIATQGLSKVEVETVRRCLLKMIENLTEDEARWPDEKMRMLSNRELNRVRR